MRFLVTGGAGFIGSNIVDTLVAKGEKVRVLDNFATGKRENLTPFVGKVEVAEGDVRSPFTVIEAMKGVDYVLHQAALPSVPRSIQDPLTTNEVNVVGTMNVLKAALTSGVKRVVYASSSSVYGDAEVLPKVETMIPNPLSPYAVSKLAGEHYCGVFSQLYGLETVCLRYFNVFGPRQDPTSQYSAVIPKFIRAVSEGKAPMVFGDGSQSRDFTFVANVVEANLRACTAPVGPHFLANVAVGKRFTLNDLVAVLNKIFGKSLKPVYAPPRLGDVKHSLADVTRMRDTLGVKVLVGFEEGLRRSVEWHTGKV